MGSVQLIMSSALGLSVALTYPTAGVSQAEFADAPDNSDRATMPYDRTYEMGEPGNAGILAEAESALRSRRYDRAVTLVKEAMVERSDDLDLHKVYAQALEGQLSEQKERDPYLYQKCLEEWLVVLRSGVGEYGGINVHGAGGVFDYLFRDDDRAMLAQKHIANLTGMTPRPWETNARFLKRAIKSNVKGKLISKQESNESK